MSTPFILKAVQVEIDKILLDYEKTSDYDVTNDKLKKLRDQLADMIKDSKKGDE